MLPALFVLALALPLPVPAAAPPGPADEGAAPPLFREVGDEALPGAYTLCGGVDKDYIVEVNGGGLVLGDFDADGHTDIVVVNGSTLERVAAGEPGDPPRLWLNGGEGRFTPAAEEGEEPAGEDGPPSWAMSGGRWGMGGAAGDVNGDGYLDLLVTQWGPERLFLNEGGRGFREATEGSGLSTAERWGTSAAFLDHDRDGHLDLVVVSYLAFSPDAIQGRATGACSWKGHPVMCGPEGLIPVHDQLYRGNGDGTFRDVTHAAGFRPRDAGYGLGAMTLDYDGDGDTDVYVTNDSTPNHLWENQGDGTFVEVGTRLNVSHDGNGKEQAGMGIGCGDVNEDGVPDLFVTNFSAENNALYVSVARSGRLTYRERSSPMRVGGPSRVDLGWGTTIADFDHDSFLDLVVFNGHVYPQADEPGTDTSYAQRDHFVRNGGDGRFGYHPLGDGAPSVSRASAAADLDGDGDLDLVAYDLGVEEPEGRVRVLENRGARGHWLRVRLAGRTANRQCLGARVVCEFERAGADGERSLVRRVEDVRTSGGFQAAVPAEVHFGLGGAERATLRVRWPDGRETEHRDVAVDRLLVLEEPAQRDGDAEVDAGGEVAR